MPRPPLQRASGPWSAVVRRGVVGPDREPCAPPHPPPLQRPGLRLKDRPHPGAGESNSARTHGSYRPDPRLSVQIGDVDREPHPERVHRTRRRQQERALDPVPAEQPASACASGLGELQRYRFRCLCGGERGHGCEVSDGVKRTFATGVAPGRDAGPGTPPVRVRYPNGPGVVPGSAVGVKLVRSLWITPYPALFPGNPLFSGHDPVVNTGFRGHPRVAG